MDHHLFTDWDALPRFVEETDDPLLVQAQVNNVNISMVYAHPFMLSNLKDPA